MKKFSIILTGGTLDSIDTLVKYDRISSKSGISNYLDHLKLHCEYDETQVCEKDSRELNDEDRENILAAVVEANNRVLVTHGTYTMGETARYLIENNERIADKVVVLVGAMTPLEGFWRTDAPFNLGFAISSLFFAEPGVYVAMNGELFKGDEVEKDVKEMQFMRKDEVPPEHLFSEEKYRKELADADI